MRKKRRNISASEASRACTSLSHSFLPTPPPPSFPTPSPSFLPHPLPLLPSPPPPPPSFPTPSPSFLPHPLPVSSLVLALCFLVSFPDQRDCSQAGAHYQERATPILSLCHGVFTDQFIFRLHFSLEN